MDRPPLLITIFKIAAELGGAVPLRLIGIGAAVIALLAVAQAAWTLAGPRAGVAAAVAAAALLVSPVIGAGEVNGELLCAPFVAVGLAAVVSALCNSSELRAAWLATLAGVSGLAAVLVKQNMLDVMVFGGVLVLLGARRLGVTRSAVVICGALAGGLVTLGAAAIWTVSHGTSLRGVWFAMYQFRVQAGALIALYPSAGLGSRERALLLGAVLSGMVLSGAALAFSAGHSDPPRGPPRRHHRHRLGPRRRHPLQRTEIPLPVPLVPARENPRPAVATFDQHAQRPVSPDLVHHLVRHLPSRRR